MEKNSVRNLQYGPKTRLIRRMYYFILITFVIYFLFVFAFPSEILALVDAIFWNSKCNHDKVFDLIWFDSTDNIWKQLGLKEYLKVLLTLPF